MALSINHTVFCTALCEHVYSDLRCALAVWSRNRNGCECIECKTWPEVQYFLEIEEKTKNQK